MALIYANAVNKRMNQPLKPKKKYDRCPYRDESPFGAREAHVRKCSSSREATPQRKASSTSSSTGSPIASTKHEHHKHRPVQRSKTSCGDMLNKIDEEALRKSSHPSMSASATSNSLVKSYTKNDIKRALAKKNLIQKYNLEHSLDSPVAPAKDNRRRSVSLDADEWDQHCRQPARKDSAFQRMKKKLSKWTLG